MRKLPFVVEPKVEKEIVRIGTDDYGYYEFVKYGCFRVKEEASITDVLHKQSEFRYKLKKLIYQINRETGKSVEFINEFINDYELDTELYGKYQQPLLELQENRVEEQLRDALVNTMFRFRFYTADTQEEGLSDWEDSEINDIEIEIRDAILMFASDEMSGANRKKHEEPETLPKKRKPRKANSNGFNPSLKQDQLTGEPSTGESEEVPLDMMSGGQNGSLEI